MKKLLATAVLSLSMVFGFSAAAFAAPNDQIVGTAPDGTNVETRVTTDEANDNGKINANNTGVGIGGQGVIDPATQFQSVNGQRTHGEYQNNTNSCASCHQTHTAAASDLLFKDGVFTTCTACHDGTLGVLNVYAPSTAGTFGGTTAGNASIHMPSGAVDVNAAPGGHTGDTTEGSWGADFNCASCHSPHGSYSDRLLKFNPNEIGSTDMYFRTSTGAYADKDGNLLADQTKPQKSGGLKVVGAQVVDTLPTADATSPEFVVYRTTSDSPTLVDNFTGSTAKDYKVTQEPAGTSVIVLMKKVSKADPTDSTITLYSYVREMNPWIGNVYNTRGTNGLDEITNFFKTYTYGDTTNNILKSNLVKFSASGAAADDGIIVKFGFAYVKNGPANGLATVGYADISRSAPVKLKFLPTPKATFNGVNILEVDINSYAATDAKASGTTGFGVAISQYCSACHTDYFVAAGTDKDAAGNELGGRGVWTKAFRHNTTSDNYTCLKCHFAHGTDVSVMLDAKDQDLGDLKTAYEAQVPAKYADIAAADAAATAYLLDKNNSSALKRYTNMSICWKCHTSSHSEDLTNNQWVQGINPGVSASTEYNQTGTNLPSGYVAPPQAGLPYQGNINTPTTANPGDIVTP